MTYVSSMIIRGHRWLAISEAMTLIVLVLVAVPLKHIGGCSEGHV
jgi:hypothetical protein